MNLSRGFLPLSDPLKHLPQAFSAWTDLSDQLPKFLVSNQFKSKLKSLPLFPISKLKSPEEYERAMLILSFLGHAYVWGDKIPASHIPSILAEPWVELAKILQRPPVLSYASYALHNWQRLNQDLPVQLGNIALLQNFLGGVDEEWFVLVHIDIEAKAAKALQALIPAQEAASNNSSDRLLKCLSEIQQSMLDVCDTLDRMPEKCDPYVYYHRVRPYIHGWKNHPALPNGVIYENCFDNQPQFFRGETGAQSSIIPALDAVLGITHQADELSIYLKEMQDYMPYEHRAFLNNLVEKGSIRSFIAKTYSVVPALRESYNNCIDLMVRFRLTHLKYAALYIQKQSQDIANNPNAVGTGGTPFMSYLHKHEQEAEKFKL
ncbi:MAG TPA: hypothetical protein VHA13_02515 [Gammaproteobacteria bacterium]|nr:hypothetical protein [Gammaproteobacteria bacterium]